MPSLIILTFHNKEPKNDLFERHCNKHIGTFIPYCKVARKQQLLFDVTTLGPFTDESLFFSSQSFFFNFFLALLAQNMDFLIAPNSTSLFCL